MPMACREGNQLRAILVGFVSASTSGTVLQSVSGEAGRQSILGVSMHARPLVVSCVAMRERLLSVLSLMNEGMGICLCQRNLCD